MVVGILVYIITWKSWKWPYPVRASLSYRRDEEPAENGSPRVAFLESERLHVAEPDMGPSIVGEPRLLHDGEWNEMMLDDTAQRV